MATTPDPQSANKEHPSTYVIKGRANEQELLRLDEQDQLFTAGMGGVLPEQPDPTIFQSVLDVGCGPGWWLIETAKTYPSINKLVGLDVSSHMVEYATNRAKAAGVNDRVSFQTGDALRLLEFPNNQFSLVNQRFGMSFLRKWDWQKLLREYYRVCKPEGCIRITEFTFPEVSSSSLTHLYDLLVQAMYNAGHLFVQKRDGVTSHLADTMAKYGIAQVQTKNHVILYNAADPEIRHHYINDLHRTFRNVAPFIQKWTKAPDDYEEIYQQMLDETLHPDFEATQQMLTAWGIKRPQRTTSP